MLSDRVERTVVAVADHPRLDDIEFVVAEEDAASLDVRGRQRGLLWLAPDADADAVVAAATELLGPDSLVQARQSDGRPFVLSLPATKAQFGEFAFRDLPRLFREHVSGQRAVDFGCGTGRSTRFLRGSGPTSSRSASRSSDASCVTATSSPRSSR